MSNPNISSLDLNQAMLRVIDSSEDAFRMMLATGTDFAIELNEADGDSVAVRSLMLSASGEIQTGASGDVIAAMDSEGFKEFQIIAKVDAAITGTAVLRLEVSPESSGSVWVDSALTLSVTGSTDLLSSVNTTLAKRIKLSLDSNTISDGSASIYLLARG